MKIDSATVVFISSLLITILVIELFIIAALHVARDRFLKRERLAKPSLIRSSKRFRWDQWNLRFSRKSKQISDDRTRQGPSA